LNFFLIGVTAEALQAITGSKKAISLQRGPVDPKFQVEGVAPTNHSSSQKTRLNDLSHGTKTWTDISSVLSQCTRLTDGQTEISSQDRACIPCSGQWVSIRDNRQLPVNLFNMSAVNEQFHSCQKQQLGYITTH